MKNYYQQLVEAQGVEAAKAYMKDIRKNVKKKTVPFKGRGYFGMLKDQGRTEELNKVIKKATEARSAKKEKPKKDEAQPSQSQTDRLGGV